MNKKMVLDGLKEEYKTAPKTLTGININLI